MATFNFNQRQTKAVQKAIEAAPDGFEVYFQFCHGGRVQVFKGKITPEVKVDYVENIPVSSKRGAGKLREKLSGKQDAVKMTDEWVDAIHSAKTFSVSVKVAGGIVTWGMQYISGQK